MKLFKSKKEKVEKEFSNNTVLSDEERKKIEEEEKLRAKIREKIEKRKQSKRAIGCLILIILAVIVIGIIISAGNSSTERSFEEQTILSFEEVKNTALGNLSYDELLRNNEKYVGKIVYYESEVSQVTEIGKDSYILRVYVTKKDYRWDDDIYINYKGKRVLEDDIVKLWGRVEGVKKYITVLGAKRSIPEITALYIKTK